jgi:hypothetical protein
MFEFMHTDHNLARMATVPTAASRRQLGDVFVHAFARRGAL